MAGCRRGDLKWAATTMENSSTTQPQQDLQVKEADEHHITQTLLMRSGDVESNPGPKSKHSSHSENEEDFDDILKDVASRIQDNKKMDTLGKALGFDPADIERYIATNTRYHHVTYDGTLKMLRDWRDTQTEATERPALADALKLAGLVRLANIFMRTPKVQKIQTASEDLPQNDILKSVVKDIKKYYKLNMCTIQANTTNNDVMFEFNRIYTDPTLSEEDRNDNKIRNPLLYRNLLKTKINGQLPNRLLVQAEGGAGKTTFCSKIAWDWAHDLGFQQFKLVAVIPLCEAKNKTVGEVIKSYLSDNNPFTAAQIDEYILSNQEDVFLVFDGLHELWGKLSVDHQIVKIIFNRLFKSGTVLVTSRQWRGHAICSSTELKKVYAFIYIEGLSVDNGTAYITKFFNGDSASSQGLVDFIYSNDVIADNMAPFPIYIALLCIMWRMSDEKGREAMSKLMTFSQLFDEMVDFLVDHCGSKDDSQTGPTVQELRQMIPNHLKAIGEIAYQGILDRRLEFPEDTFQGCRESMEMGCKVGVLTREKHATLTCDGRTDPNLEMSMVQFPHKLFQEFMAAKYLASLHSSDHDRYEKILADILARKEDCRYLLYFTSAQREELGLDIVTRLIDQEATDYMDEAYKSNTELGRFIRRLNFSKGVVRSLIPQERKEHFIVDVAYESQHKSVAEKVGNQLMRSRTTLKIHEHCSAHTVSGYLFIKDHLGEVDSLVLQKACGHTASQDLAEFILSSASLKIMTIYSSLDAVFYSMLADKGQQCRIQNLKICFADLHDQPLPSRDLAEFICQMLHLESLELCNNMLHEEFFSKWASIVSSAKVNNRSATPHTSLRELIVDDCTMLAWQSCGDMFSSVEKLSICFRRDFECDFIQRVHGFQGVTELSILGSVKTTPCEVKGEPSTMFRQLVRFFPQLIKMTFRIQVGNAILDQISESMKETGDLPLKSVSVPTRRVCDGLDELSALINRITDENVLSVEVKPEGDKTPKELGKDTRLDCLFEESQGYDNYDEYNVGGSDDNSFNDPDNELIDANVDDYYNDGGSDDEFNDDEFNDGSDDHSFYEQHKDLIGEFENDDFNDGGSDDELNDGSNDHSFHEEDNEFIGDLVDHDLDDGGSDDESNEESYLDC